MHPLRKLREAGKPTPAQIGELLAENVKFNSPILVRPIEGREVCAAIFAQSSATTQSRPMRDNYSANRFLFRDQGVGGSNPLSPTNCLQTPIPSVEASKPIPWFCSRFLRVQQPPSRINTALPLFYPMQHRLQIDHSPVMEKPGALPIASH